MKHTRREAIYRGVVQTTVVLGVTRLFSPEDLPLVGPIFRWITKAVKSGRGSREWTENFNQVPVLLSGIEMSDPPIAWVRTTSEGKPSRLTIHDSYDSRNSRVVRAKDKIKELQGNIGQPIRIPLCFEEECPDTYETKQVWAFRKGGLPTDGIRRISEGDYKEQLKEGVGTVGLIRSYGRVRQIQEKEDGRLEIIIDTADGDFEAILRHTQTSAGLPPEELKSGDYIEFRMRSAGSPTVLYFNEGYAPAHLINTFTKEELASFRKKD